MRRLMVVIASIGLLTACSNNGDDKQAVNPYKETHIVDVVPDYQITSDPNPKLKKPLEEMTEEELKARYGELQRQSALTPAQQKEFNMIAVRLAQLSEYKLKTEQTIHIKKEP